MLTSLKVKDYQSIGNADIPLVGLTVIVGPGNLGKSALVRALCALIFNETGTDFIRKGCPYTQVTVELSEGKRIIWTREAKGGASYSVEGIGDVMDSQDYRKLAGAVPQDITDLLGIRTIEVAQGFNVTPQVHGQFDQPLLLMESAGKVARALAQMTKLSVLVEAQVASARDLRKAKQDITRLGRVLEDLDRRLDSLSDPTEAEGWRQEAVDLLEEARDAYDDLEEAADLWRSYQAAQAQQDIILPDARELDEASEALDGLAQAAESLVQYQEAKERISQLERERDSLSETLKRYEGLLEEQLDALEICPLCGTVLGGHD